MTTTAMRHPSEKLATERRIRSCRDEPVQIEWQGYFLDGILERVGSRRYVMTAALWHPRAGQRVTIRFRDPSKVPLNAHLTPVKKRSGEGVVRMRLEPRRSSLVPSTSQPRVWGRRSEAAPQGR